MRTPETPYRGCIPSLIDENLMRHELSSAERSQQTARRKELYEALHPETAHGAVGNGRGQSRQNGDSTSRFTKATAAATGQSERVIQRAVARGKGVLRQLVGLLRRELIVGPQEVEAKRRAAR